MEFFNHLSGTTWAIIIGVLFLLWMWQERRDREKKRRRSGGVAGQWVFVQPGGEPARKSSRLKTVLILGALGIAILLSVDWIDKHLGLGP